ncbi:HpcH/HpaI aldolase/citrate lyase family protein [Saliphagus sp. GCM10025334]
MQWQNDFRQTIEQDEAVLGARATTISPPLIEVYGSIGFDFVWLDFEHSGPSATDSPVLENLSRAGEVADIDLLLRLPSGEPNLVRKALDAGIRTLLIPRVETATDVRRAVKASRFYYNGGGGERGSASGRSSIWGSPADYPAREDRSVCVGVMIENQTALNNIDEILAVPKLGFIFVGPGDLSVSLGHPLKKEHSAVQEAIETIRTRALENEVPIGRIANDPNAARTAINDGYQVLRVGDEMSATRTVLGDRLEQITK